MVPVSILKQIKQYNNPVSLCNFQFSIRKVCNYVYICQYVKIYSITFIFITALIISCILYYYMHSVVHTVGFDSRYQLVTLTRILKRSNHVIFMQTKLMLSTKRSRMTVILLTWQIPGFMLINIDLRNNLNTLLKPIKLPSQVIQYQFFLCRRKFEPRISYAIFAHLHCKKTQPACKLLCLYRKDMQLQLLNVIANMLLEISQRRDTYEESLTHNLVKYKSQFGRDVSTSLSYICQHIYIYRCTCLCLVDYYEEF